MSTVAASERNTSRSDAQLNVIPKGTHLIITTAHYVFSWNNDRLTEIFRSESGGIIAAKEAHNGSATLAVADSQVVILHDVKRGMEKTYRLKGTEGQVHLLHFSKDLNTLYFTTSLQNAVQSYSLTDSRLLDPTYAHPTPPAVFALSPLSHLLLSSSNAPPTTYLHDLKLRRPPLLLQPSASDAAVVVAAFHPGQPDMFLLGFADGTLAAYNANFLMGTTAKEQLKNKHVYTGRGGEIGHFKKLHVSTSKGAQDPEGVYDAAVYGGYDYGTATASAGSVCIGITGAAFIPGYQSRAVTVGGDGRCRIVDFANGGMILRTWHLQAPATALSILSETIKNISAESEGHRKRQRSISPKKRAGLVENKVKFIIAVGRDDGWVQLYDSLGLERLRRQIDPSAGPIIDVEWVDGPGYRTQPVMMKEVRGKAQIQQPPQKEKDRMKNAKETKPRPIGPMLGAERKIEEQIVMADNETPVSKALPPLPPGDWEESIDDDGTVRRRSLRVSGQPSLPPLPTSQHADLFSPTQQLQLPRRQNSQRPRFSSTTFANVRPAQPSSSHRNKEPASRTPIRPRTASLTHSLLRKSLGRKRRNTSSDYYCKMPGAYVSSTTSLTTTASGEQNYHLTDHGSFGNSGPNHQKQSSALPSPKDPASTSQNQREKPSMAQLAEALHKLATSDPDADVWLTDVESPTPRPKVKSLRRTTRSRQLSAAKRNAGQLAGLNGLLARTNGAPSSSPSTIPPPPPPPPLPPPVPSRSLERPVKFRLRSQSISPRKLDRALTDVSGNAQLFSAAGTTLYPAAETRLSSLGALNLLQREDKQEEARRCDCELGQLREEIRMLREQMHADVLAMREEMAEGFKRQRDGLEKMFEEVNGRSASWDS